MDAENETKCPNCSGAANRFEYKHKLYIECDECGTFEIDSAGEARAVEDLKIKATGASSAESEADSAQSGSGTAQPGLSPDPSIAAPETDEIEPDNDKTESLLEVEISIDDSED